MASSIFSHLIPDASYHIQQTIIDSSQNPSASRLGFASDISINISYNDHLTTCKVSVSPLNIMGYIPVISTFSGTYRTVIGLAYLIKCVACKIFDSSHREDHQAGIKIAKTNIYRGIVEMIPIVGNICTRTYDVRRVRNCLRQEDQPLPKASNWWNKILGKLNLTLVS